MRYPGSRSRALRLSRLLPRAALVALFAALLPAFLAACSSPGTPLTVDGVTLLRYGPQSGLPTALLTGTLDIRDGCVWVDDGNKPWLTLWPPDSTLEQVDGRLTIGLRGVFSGGDGDRVALGGGIRPDANEVRQLVGALPEACATNDVWLVSSANRAPA